MAIIPAGVMKTSGNTDYNCVCCIMFVYLIYAQNILVRTSIMVYVNVCFESVNSKLPLFTFSYIFSREIQNEKRSEYIAALQCYSNNQIKCILMPGESKLSNTNLTGWNEVCTVDDYYPIYPFYQRCRTLSLNFFCIIAMQQSYT